MAAAAAGAGEAEPKFDLAQAEDVAMSKQFVHPFTETWVSDGAMHRVETPGMSLRDYFAGQALAGLLPNYATLLRGEGGLASDAYALADAMLAERAKP